VYTKHRVKVKIPHLDEVELHPKETERILDQLHAEESKILEISGEEAMEEATSAELSENDEKSSKMVNFVPVDLDIAFHAPIDTIREKNLLYMVTKSVAVELYDHGAPGKPHPQLLGYLKQMSEQLNDLHKMTEPEQDKVHITKLQVVQMIMESRQDVSEDFKIQFLKEMQAKRLALEEVEVVE